MFLKFLLWLISKLSDSQLSKVRDYYLISGPYQYELERLHTRISELEGALSSSESVPEPVTEIFSRMNYEVYEYFERTVSNTSVASSTTDLEAGFKLGVQHVLAKLRNGYVTPRSL